MTSIAGGTRHSLALKGDGTVVAWGCVGQDVAQCSVPAGLDGVTAIASSSIHSLALQGPLGPAQMIIDLIDKTLQFLDRHPLRDTLRARLEQVAGAVIQQEKALACWLLNLYIAIVRTAPLAALSFEPSPGGPSLRRL